MPVKISKITTQKKNKHRYNIFIDYGTHEEYAFSVDEDVLITYELRKGLPLTEEFITEIESADRQQTAYNKVLRYLSYRMRTEQEVRTYLQKEELTEEHIDIIVERLKKNGFLDDLQFAEMFVRSRLNNSAKGPEVIRQELESKGIKSKYIRIALEQFSRDEERLKAIHLAKKRINRRSNDSFQKQINKIKAYLMRNGFSKDAISHAVQEILDLQTDDEEWEAIQYHGERLERRLKKKYEEYELRQKIKEGLYRQGFSISLINEYLQKND